MTTGNRLAVSAALAALALTTVACSTKLSTRTPPPTTTAPTTTVEGAATPAQTKGATYRAELTYLTVEHVFLLGRVTQEVVTAGGVATQSTTTTVTAAPASTTTSAAASGSTSAPSTSSTTTSTTVPETTTTSIAVASVPGGDDASTALDKNSHDISDLLAEAQGYGSDFGASFYALWTARINDFAQYATAKATKDSAGTKAATSALASNATAIATLVHQVNKYVAVTTVSNPGTGLADELGPDNTAVTTFIDSQVAKNATAVDDIVNAAEKIRHTATVLAAAAAKLDPAQYPGTVTGTAANLRAGVTSALVEHVELVGLTTAQLATGHDGAAESAALDANSAALDNVAIVNFGDPAGREFLAGWGKYVSQLEAYAKAKAGGGTAPDLSGVGQTIGAFFAAHAPQLSAALIGSDFQQMVDALKTVVDAQASQAPAVTDLRVAAAFVPKLASDLSEGIAEYKPTQYAA
jgi:hypothetical protein